jgi:hypothetical protein
VSRLEAAAAQWNLAAQSRDGVRADSNYGWQVQVLERVWKVDGIRPVVGLEQNLEEYRAPPKEQLLPQPARASATL